jgi:hypothetical protein
VVAEVDLRPLGEVGPLTRAGALALERAVLVSKQRSGREQRVAANPETMRKAATLLAVFEHLWIHRATKIAELLAEEGTGT